MDLEEIKSRINPQYQDMRGTESHERKWLCDEIERLRQQLEKSNLYADHLGMSLRDVKRERDELYRMNLAQAQTINKLEELFGVNK